MMKRGVWGRVGSPPRKVVQVIIPGPQTLGEGSLGFDRIPLQSSDANLNKVGLLDRTEQNNSVKNGIFRQIIPEQNKTGKYKTKVSRTKLECVTKFCSSHPAQPIQFKLSTIIFQNWAR